MQRRAHHRPTRHDLRDRLPNLTYVQFEATLQATLDDPHSGLEVGPGGRYFRYYGSEGTGAVGQIAIYAVVRSKLEQGWGPRRGGTARFGFRRSTFTADCDTPNATTRRSTAGRKCDELEGGQHVLRDCGFIDRTHPDSPFRRSNSRISFATAS